MSDRRPAAEWISLDPALIDRLARARAVASRLPGWGLMHDAGWARFWVLIDEYAAAGQREVPPREPIIVEVEVSLQEASKRITQEATGLDPQTTRALADEWAGLADILSERGTSWPPFERPNPVDEMYPEDAHRAGRVFCPYCERRKSHKGMPGKQSAGGAGFCNCGELPRRSPGVYADEAEAESWQPQTSKRWVQIGQHGIVRNVATAYRLALRQTHRIPTKLATAQHDHTHSDLARMLGVASLACEDADFGYVKQVAAIAATELPIPPRFWNLEASTVLGDEEYAAALQAQKDATLTGYDRFDMDIVKTVPFLSKRVVYGARLWLPRATVDEMCILDPHDIAPNSPNQEPTDLLSVMLCPRHLMLLTGSDDLGELVLAPNRRELMRVTGIMSKKYTARRVETFPILETLILPHTEWRGINTVCRANESDFICGYDARFWADRADAILQGTAHE